VSFWIPEDKSVHPNDIAEIVRGLSTEDLVEKVELIDEFENKKTGQTSNCFRLTYRSMDRSLTNEEIDKLQFQFRDELVEAFGVTLR
jgi:phenylalanyl-tRNA synthetase alpha chain